MPYEASTGATPNCVSTCHLRSHRTTAADYKRRFGYNLRRALMCAALHRRYAERAVGRALAATIRRRPTLDDPELRLRKAARPITLGADPQDRVVSRPDTPIPCYTAGHG